MKATIKHYLKSFDDDTPTAVDRADEAASVIRDLGRLAVEKGYAQVARIASATKTPLLGLPAARIVLAEMLQAIDDKPTDGLLTTAEVAKRLKINRDKVLGWIAYGRLRATNVSKGFRPRWRIRQEDLDLFLSGGQNPAKTEKKRGHGGQRSGFGNYKKIFPES